MKISKFLVESPDASGEMAAEVTVAVDNATSHESRWVQYRIVLENGQGFPIQYAEGFDDCRLAKDEQFEFSSSCTLPSCTAGTRRDDIVARVSATLHAREFFRLGEIAAPGLEFECETVSREIRSEVLEPDLRLTLLRVKNDEEGQARVECRVMLRNRSTVQLERVVLKCELLDADEAPVDESEDSMSIPAGLTACLEGGTPWVKASRLKNAKIRLSLSVYRPVLVVACEGTSSPGLDAVEGLEDSNEQDASDQEDSIQGADREGSDEEPGDEHDGDEAGEDAEDGPARMERDEVDTDSDGQCHGLEPAVEAALRKAGALDHADAFRTNQITDDVLSSLSDSDLAAMGITAIGLRKRILAAIMMPPKPRPVERPKVVDWALVVDPFVAAMSPISRAVLNPAWDHKKLQGARSFAPQVTASTRVLLAYDDTMFGSGKDGLLVTDLGVHWRNAFEDPHFIPWTEFTYAIEDGKKISLMQKRGGTGCVNCSMAGAAGAAVMARFINRASGAALAWVEHSRLEQADELEEALLAMESVEGDAFVVLRDDYTDAYVQFCLGEDGLQIDIPIEKSVRDHREERLLGFVEQLGLEHDTNEDFECYWREFSKDEVGDLIRLAFHAMLEGQAEDEPYDIECGWEPQD